jgi:hypothetical protein
MSRDKGIIIGVLVLGGLSFLVWQQAKKDQSLGSADKATADLPEIKGTDDVDKISITNGDKGEVVLEKKDDKWVVTKPVNAPANQNNVKSLLDNLKELKTKEVVASAPDDAVKKEYSLDPGHVVHLVAWKGADKKVDDSFGKSGGRGEMVMKEGSPSIYAASGYSGYLYTREVKDWREREIFKFDDANATQLQIENKNGSFSFTKGDKWAGTFKGQPIDRLDEEKIKDAIRALKFLNADDFGDGKSNADTGLDAPDGTITVTLKDNAGKYTLKVGKTSSGSSHYALKDGDATIFVVGQTVSDWATAEASKFQKSLDAGAPKSDAGGAKSAAMPMGMPPMGQMPMGHPKVP